MSAMLGQCLAAWRPAKRVPDVVVSAKRRQRSAGSKADVYERMMETLVDVRSVVVGNLHSTYRCQDWRQVVLLHRAIGEVAKKSLQLTRIEDEIKESHQMLNMHQGGGRGGVRRGGQNRVQAQETSQKAVQEAEKKISKLKKEKDAVLKDTIEIIDTVCIRVLQEEETADELMAVLQLLATEIEAAKRKYTPERLQVWALHASQGRIRDPDNSESECDEQPEPATGPEEQEDLPHVVLSDSGASLGIEDITSLCQVLSRLEEGQGLQLATTEGTPCIIRPSHQPCSPKSSALFHGVAMNPIELPQTRNRITPCGDMPLSSPDPLQPFSDDDSDHHVAQRMFALVTCEKEANVNCVSGADKVVSDGILQLDAREYIVFDSTCCDVHVRNTVIQGGTIVCVGEGCSTTFSGVKFENCRLVVTGGAHVTVNKHASFTADSSQPVSMFVDGPGSSITAGQVTITGGRAGVVVQSGACVSATRMHVKDVECQALVVQGSGSSAELDKCQVHDSCHQHSSDNVEQPGADYLGTDISECLLCSISSIRSAGILALDGGHVSLADVKVKSFACGLVVRDGGDMQATDSEVTAQGEIACLVSGGTFSASKSKFNKFGMLGCAIVGDTEASAMFSDCRVFGGSWGGVCAMGSNATLHMEGGKASHGSIVCVDALCGAQVRLCNMALSKSSAGFRASGKGTRIEVHGGTLKGLSTVGAGASDHAIMQLHDTLSMGNVSKGYVCKSGADLWLENCQSVNSGIAVEACYQGSQVIAVNCDLRGSKEAAVHVHQQSFARLQHCTIVGASNDGVMASGEGCTIDVQGGSISKCTGAGISIKDKAVGRVSSVYVLSSAYGIVGCTAAQVEVHKCTVEMCTRFGIMASESSTIEASHSTTFMTAKDCGWAARLSGLLNMKDCTSLADQVGCSAWENGRIVAIKTTVKSSVHGVEAHEKGLIELGDCTVSKCVWLGVNSRNQGSHITMDSCIVSHCMWTGVEALDGSKMDLRNVAITHTEMGLGASAAHKGTHMLLEACTVEDNRLGGIFAMDDGVIELKRTQFARNFDGDLKTDSGGRVVEATSAM